MPEQYVIADPAQHPWTSLQKEGWPEGTSVRMQHLLKGVEGGPDAIRTMHPEGYGSDAHFHQGAQFQLIIGGSLLFDSHRIDSLAVHYTDHNVPYGPFVVTPDHEMLVLHARAAPQVLSKHPAARAQANRRGKQIVATERTISWEAAGEGLRRKLLICEKGGPTVTVFEASAGVGVPEPAAPHGRYDVVLNGTATAGDHAISRNGYRFVRGDAAPALRGGPEGSTIIALEFGDDAEWRPE